MIELEHKSGVGTYHVITDGDWLRILKTNSIGQTSVELHGLEIEMLEEFLRQRHARNQTKSC